MCNSEKVEQSWLPHGYGQNQQERTWLLFAKCGNGRAGSLWVQPQLWQQQSVSLNRAVNSRFCYLTLKHLSTLNRQARQDGLVVKSSFIHLQELTHKRLVPNLSIWHHSSHCCFGGKLCCSAMRDLISLMDRDQMMGWWLRRHSYSVKEQQ